MNPEEGTSSGGNGFDVHICSEEERRMPWMRDTKIRLFMQMEVVACRDEPDCDAFASPSKLPRNVV